MKKALLLVLIFTLIFTFGSCSSDQGASAQTESWKPTENIEFVCHSSPGGGSDLMARSVSQYMASENIIDATIYVNNLTGANGVKAFTYTYEHAGDPYIFQTAPSGFFVSAITGQMSMKIDDFTMLAVLGTDTLALCTSTDSGITSLEQVVDASKANPKSISCGTGSAGSSGSCASIIFEKAAGIELNNVPFDGGGEALVAVMGNQIDVSWHDYSEVAGGLQSGMLKLLAVANTDRSAAAPDTPTFKELGYDVVFEVPRAIVMPPDIPKEAYDFYVDAFTKLDASETWQKNYLEANYITPKFAAGDDAVEVFQDFYNVIHDIYAQIGLAVD